MISIDRVMKHQDLHDDILNFHKMEIVELEYYYKRYKRLKSNTCLLNALADKGDKINKQIDFIEKLIIEKHNKNFSNKTQLSSCSDQSNKENENIEKLLTDLKQLNLEKNNNLSKNEKILSHLNEVEKNDTKKEVDDQKDLDKRFQRLIDKIDDENAKLELLNDLKSPENMDKINEKSQNNENYFLLSTSNNSNQENKKEPKKHTKKDLNDVKKKLLEKYKPKMDESKSKTIPLNESLVLIEEKTKKLQELQMQQAAQKLLKGSQANNYDYSNVDRLNDKKQYRSTRRDSDDGGYSDNYDEEDENEYYNQALSNESGDEDEELNKVD